MVRLAILIALACVLRLSTSILPNITAVTAFFFSLTIWSSLVDGIVVAWGTMIITGLVLGFGPWIFLQIIVYTLLVSLFWLMARFMKKILMQAILAGGLAFFYGIIIDFLSSLTYTESLGNSLATIGAGLPFDLLHGASTLIFFPILLSILRKAQKN